MVFCFAALYLAIGMDGVQGARIDSLSTMIEDAVFFSAHTLTTVGYGSLSPGSIGVSVISSVEAMVGLVLFGMFTGLAFGRVARVAPRFAFSTHAIIAPYKPDLDGIMIRMANERDGDIMDATSTVVMVVETTQAQRAMGMGRRRFYQLDLALPTITAMTMNWTIVHEITNDSPLREFTIEELAERNMEIIVSLRAFDETVGQTFYSRTSYKAHDLLVGRKFVPMFSESTGGDVELDLNLLSVTEPATLASQQ
jgi:inward rectifier potassium channel